MITIHRNNQLGFSLIELMVAMVISSFLMAAVYSFFTSSSKISIIQETSVAATQSVRAGLELMVQDIQMAGYNPSGDVDIEPIYISPDGRKIRVQSDRNEDGDINNTYEEITYELSAGQLKQTLYKKNSSQYLIDNVTGLTFTHIGSKVDIELEVTETGGGEPIVRSLKTTVYCRNLDL